MNTDTHFWFGWRLRVLEHLLRDGPLPPDKPALVLEIGCGTGFLRTQIERATKWTVDAADIDPAALSQAAASRGRTLLYRIEERRPELKEQYDALVLFDVLEHIQDPLPFFENACWHLKPGGLVIVNVPAMAWFYSRYDKLVGHWMRYDQKSLEQLCARSGVKRIDARYWGFFMTPLILWRKWRLKNCASPREAVERGFATPAPWINQALGLLMQFETGLFKRPPLGTSLMALLQKS
jgi:SAM-dependent methyltransferase